MEQKTISLPTALNSSRIQDYIQLTKFRLSSLVVFSAAMGYIIAMGRDFNWLSLFILSLGGFLVTGASNTFNQIIEKDLDKLMVRTANRPIPTNRMTTLEALIAGIAMGVSGVTILWVFLNPLCGILSFISLLLYVLAYTPAKKITPFSVLIGALPGAFPPLLGWVAGRNEIGMEALILYAIQFIWQFPHFWAIAWVLHDDYERAGFKMLPSGHGRTKGSAFQTLVYTICLIPMGMFPVVFGFTNIIASLLMVITGGVFTYQALQLYRNCDLKSAQRLMFGSFFYLPVVQIIWMINKLV